MYKINMHSIIFFYYNKCCVIINIKESTDIDERIGLLNIETERINSRKEQIISIEINCLLMSVIRRCVIGYV